MQIFGWSVVALLFPLWFGFQAGRVPEPGIPIVIPINAPADVLQKFSKVQVRGILKDGKEVNIEWRGDARRISISSFGLRATEQEKRNGKTFPDNGRPPVEKVWGVEDTRAEWHNFDDIKTIIVEHTTETPDKTFDGFRTEFRFVWTTDTQYKGFFWKIEQGAQQVFFGNEISATLGTRLIGRRINFLLESQSGPSALRQSREQVSLQIDRNGSTSTEQYAGGDEVILPQNTRVTGCKLGANSQQRYTLASNCDWTWAPNGGAAKIVLLGKDVDLIVPYDRDGVTAAPKFSAMAAYLTKANGNLVQASVAAGSGDNLVIKGSTTMTSVRFSLTGDTNFEDLDSVEVPLDGERLKLLRRRPGVIVLLDATQELNPIRDVVIPQVAKAADDLRTSPLARKVTFAVSQAERYDALPEIAKVREYFSGYRIDGSSHPDPVDGLKAATAEASKYNSNISSLKNRIIYIVPNDIVMERPWRENERPLDPDKIDLFVIELGMNHPTPSAKDFMDKFFGAASGSHYRFVRTADDISRAIVEFALR
jgi:hypothetical protein